MAFLPWFSQVMKHVPEFKHMNHSIDSKALLWVPGVQCALELSDGSRPPSVTRVHRKMFIRCISGLYVYKNRSENDKIRNKTKIKEKKTPKPLKNNNNNNKPSNQKTNKQIKK